MHVDWFYVWVAMLYLCIAVLCLIHAVHLIL